MLVTLMNQGVKEKWEVLLLGGDKFNAEHY